MVQPSLDATELIAIFTTNNFLIMTIHKMMRQVLCIAASFALSLHSLPAQEVVMRIDDMGAFHSVNKACVEGYRNGIATSVEVLVVGPWFPEAVKMLKENPGLDAGVHQVEAAYRLSDPGGCQRLFLPYAWAERGISRTVCI